MTHVISSERFRGGLRHRITWRRESLGAQHVPRLERRRSSCSTLRGTIDADAQACRGPRVLVLDPAGLEPIGRIEKDTDRDSAAMALAKKIGELTRDRRRTSRAWTAGWRWGYDPVAYPTSRRPRRGCTDSVRVLRRDVPLHEPEHREKFNADPEHYPSCVRRLSATAMAYGRKVEVDPRTSRSRRVACSCSITGPARQRPSTTGTGTRLADAEGRRALATDRRGQK